MHMIWHDDPFIERRGRHTRTNVAPFRRGNAAGLAETNHAIVAFPEERFTSERTNRHEVRRRRAVIISRHSHRSPAAVPKVSRRHCWRSTGCGWRSPNRHSAGRGDAMRRPPYRHQMHRRRRGPSPDMGAIPDVVMHDVAGERRATHCVAPTRWGRVRAPTGYHAPRLIHRRRTWAHCPRCTMSFTVTHPSFGR